MKLDLKRPPLLQLRLRAGFGVGARSEVLTCLLGFGGKTATLRDLISATCLSRSTVNRALAAMESAGLIAHSGPRPAKFALSIDPWKEVLGAAAFNHGDTMKFARYLPPRIKYAASPKWRPWMHLYRFLAVASFECTRALGNAKARPPLAAKLHREYARLRHASWATGSRLDTPGHALGDGIIGAAPEIIGELREWYLARI